jgi:hypothetical protein
VTHPRRKLGGRFGDPQQAAGSHGREETREP